MTLLHPGSRFGEWPHYVALADGAHAATVRELFSLLPDEARAIDVVGLRQYFDRRPDGVRTCFQRISRLPAGCDLRSDGNQLRVCPRVLPESDGPLLPLLEARIAAQLAGVRNPAVALSGGLDSALVLALVRRVAGRGVPVLTLATGLPGYCELDDTLETARAVGGGDVEIVRVRADELVLALPEAIAACETPLFNLHPVSKLLLARAAAVRGYDAVITGDGADQVFAGAEARNYLPIVGALVRAAGVALVSPFFDEHIVGWAARQGTDADKTALRTAAAVVLPPGIAWRKKSSRYAPDFSLDHQRDPALEARLAPQLALLPPAAGAGPEQTLWATTAMLIRQQGGTG